MPQPPCGRNRSGAFRYHANASCWRFDPDPLEHTVARETLAAADDFAEAFIREHVDAQLKLRPRGSDSYRTASRLPCSVIATAGRSAAENCFVGRRGRRPIRRAAPFVQNLHHIAYEMRGRVTSRDQLECRARAPSATLPLLARARRPDEAPQDHHVTSVAYASRLDIRIR